MSAPSGGVPNQPGAISQNRLAELRGTRTHDNLKAAFSFDAEASHLYFFFAKIAEIEGYPAIARTFREIGDEQTLFAHGHLDFLRRVADPLTGLPMGETEQNLQVAAARAALEASEQLAAMARTADAEGFPDVSSWLTTVSRARLLHALTFKESLSLTQADSAAPDSSEG